MKKKKVTIISVITLAICFIVGLSYVHHNLSTYYIYYAKHMPHAKDTNPEMVFTLEHLDSMGESAVDGIRYDTDGNNSIIKENILLLTQAPDSIYIQYAVIPKDASRQGKENYRTYYFGPNGRFYSYYYQKADTGKDVYDKSDIRKQEAQRYVDEVINPIVEKMEVKPKINLQWLFNQKYQKRFSGA